MTNPRYVRLPDRPIPWFRWGVVLVIGLVLLAYGLGIWHAPVERVIQEALAPYLDVEQVQVHSIGRVSLLGVRLDDGHAKAIHVHFSLPTLLTKGLIESISKVEFIEPTIASFPSIEGSEHSVSSEPFWALPFAHPTGLVIDVRSGRLFPGQKGSEWLLDGELIVRSVDGGVSGTWRARELEAPDVQFDRVWVDFACDGNVLVCEGHIEGTHGRVFHHSLTDLSADFLLDRTGWTVYDGTGTGPHGNKFAVRAQGAYDSQHPIKLTIDTEGTPVQEGLQWIESDFVGRDALDGRLFGTVRLEWANDSFTVHGAGRVEDGKFSDALIDTVSFRFHIVDGDSNVSAEVTAGPGRLTTRDLRVESGHANGTVHIENFPVPTLARAMEGLELGTDHIHKIGGRVDGTVNFVGSVASGFDTHVDLRSNGLSYQGLLVSPFVLEADINSNGEWELHRAQAHRLMGTGQGVSFDDFAAEIRWEDVETSWIETLFAFDVLSAQGVSFGHVTLRFGEDEISGEGHVGITMEAGAEPVRFDGQFVHAVTGEGRVSGVVQAENGNAEFDGSWDTGGRLNDLTANLINFPAKFIAPWIRLPAIDASLSGELRTWANGGGWNVWAHVTGPSLRYDQIQIEDVQLNADVVSGLPPDQHADHCVGCMWGEVSFTGQMTPSTVGQRIGSPLNVRLVLQGREAVLQPVTVGLWGGNVRAEGRATSEEGHGWALDFRASGKRLRYQNKGTTLHLDFAGQLTGPLDSPITKGDVNVSRGDIDLLDLPTFGGAGLRAGSGSHGGLSRVGMDVAVDVRNVHLYARSLLDAELEGVIQVKGVMSRPELYGAFESRRGMFRYARTRFDFTEGRASFNGVDLFPRLDVIGEAHIDGRIVEAGVSGPADDVTLSFRVDGRPDQTEALRLVGSTTPGDWDTNDWAGLGQALWAWLDEEFMSEAYWQIGRVLEQALDVDRFRLEQAHDEGDLQLDIGKYVTSDLYLSYRRSLLNPRQQGLGLEYSVSPGVRIHSRWFGDNGPDLGVEMQFPF